MGDPFKVIVGRRIGLEAERAELLKRIGEIDRNLSDYETTLRVLQSVGIAPEEPVLQFQGRVIPGPPARPGETDAPFSVNSPMVAPDDPTEVIERPGHLLIKDIVLSALRDAYPRGLVAAAIRRNALSACGLNVNPNTLTVTLGRFKNAGLARIEGREWFYIPQPDLETSDGKYETAGDLLEGHMPAASASRSGSPADEPTARPVEPVPGGST